MKGQDIIVVFSRSGSAVAATGVKSQDITSTCDTIETASASQGDWKDYTPGRKGWSLTVSYLVLSSSQLGDLLEIGQVFQVSVQQSDGSYSVGGSAILTQVKQTAAFGNLATGSFQFIGSGNLTGSSSSS